MYTENDQLRSISFHIKEEIWTCTTDCFIKCINSLGENVKEIVTKSGEMLCDINVSCDGDLLYCDWTQKTVNKIENRQIKEIIKLEKWKSINIILLCAISPYDILVVMRNDDNTESKVVRFSGDEKKQTIQFDKKKCKPLYSGNDKIKYFVVNKDKNKCVADWEAGAVVVVRQTGELRFRYTGYSLNSKGITTNSQGQIFTADYHNHWFHILAQDRQFLSNIENMEYPYGLCVDNHDNLMVAEHFTGDVKVIKYRKEIAYTFLNNYIRNQYNKFAWLYFFI